MTVQKYIELTINYFLSKFYLENNSTKAQAFENIKEKFDAVNASAKEGKLAPSKKHFSDFITILKEVTKSLENSSDRRLLRSLQALSFMIRRESNKQKSYLNVLNLDVNTLNAELELSKAVIFSDKKVFALKFPRK